MNIDNVQFTATNTNFARPAAAPTVIEPVDIKAILYLGLRGDVALPSPEHKVDILV
ncbi:MAG: hypothetical protein JEY99_13140 [Spirochaetales bacterium]|nr:hypothetical protein [Spirochaetales bacterium]